MCGYGLTSFSIINGGSYHGDVWFEAFWALEGRTILCNVFDRRRDETTQIMSCLNLAVWDIEEDQVECSVHTRHVIVCGSRSNVSESVDDLFYQRQNTVRIHAFKIIGRIGLGGNRAGASCWNWKSQARGRRNAPSSWKIDKDNLEHMKKINSHGSK